MFLSLRLCFLYIWIYEYWICWNILSICSKVSLCFGHGQSRVPQRNHSKQIIAMVYVPKYHFIRTSCSEAPLSFFVVFFSVRVHSDSAILSLNVSLDCKTLSPLSEGFPFLLFVFLILSILLCPHTRTPLSPPVLQTQTTPCSVTLAMIKFWWSRRSQRV